MKRPIALLVALTFVVALGSAVIAAPCDKAAETAKAEGAGCAKKAEPAVAKADGAGCAKEAKDCCAKKGDAAVAKAEGAGCAKDAKSCPKAAKATEVAKADVEKK